MKKALILLLLVQISIFQYGQIIADHTVVDAYDEIPPYYLDEVKKMLVDIAGESHSLGYRIGQNLLEQLDSRYQVLTYDGTPPAYSNQYLRLGKHGEVGEAEFYTSQAAINSYKNLITNQNNSGNPFNVIGFGWCWDMTWLNAPGGVLDPVYKVHWAGSSVGGPEGNLRWGLDSGDQPLTGNSVCMDTYLNAVNQYIQHCNTNGYPTKVIFTTGPVDGDAASENGFQREIKHDYIRSFVQTNSTYYLFDYADILCWSNAGAEYITNWNDGGTLRPHANIHPDNMLDYDASWNKVSHTEDGDHIGEVGTLRLAKAMWWLLARIAGWDGGSTTIPVTGITVTGAGGSSVISSDNGTLQLTATVLPTDATNKTVTWSIVNGTGQATINATGLVTAVANGTVTARATANDGSGVVGSLVITISGQIIPVTGITVTGASGATTITTDNGQLQLTAAVMPADATNKTVTWSIVNGTGQATINPTGLVTAVANGTVTASATANDGSGVVGSLVITISGQVIPVTDITVTGAGGSSVISSDNGTLQLTATVLPTNATNKTVTWSIVNGTGQATINATGLVTAVANGTVTARATANDGSGVVGSLVITISGQVIPVTSITVTGASGATTITTDNGQLQLTATVLPSDATNKTVTWSIVNGTGQATINPTGLLTAVANGTVTARATANDGSGVVGSLVITITGQIIPVTSITVTGAGGSSVISSDNGQLQLTASVLPADATNKTVTWSIVNGTGQATINATGLVTAVANGTVTAIATANDGSGVAGTLVITITNQFVPVSSITVTGATTITTDNGQLQLTATVLPSDATNKTVTWSMVNGTGQATINPTGLVTAVANGTVTASATANDGSGIVGSLVITISGQIIPVTGITVTGAGGSSVISSDNGQLQLTATLLPADATNKTVTWSIVNGTGQATINSTGLVTAVANGTVTARATANDGSGVVGSLVITISGQIIPVTGITVTGASGATTITTDNGQLQLTASVLPADATNKTVTWSIVNGTGQATINPTGLVTAVANGTVTARATANDGSGVVGSLVITISGQSITVTGITVTGASGATTITTDNGQLQLTATVLPTDATNKTVTWSIVNGTGQATINAAGLVTAVSNGTVTARATANDGSGVVGSLVITISGQIILVTSITVTGAGGSTVISSDNGQLQLTATVLPTDASNKTVTWSIVNGTGQATINITGLVTAVSNGTVTASATANDGSGIVGSLVITITGQIIPVSSITVTGATTITTDNGTLQLTATVTPTDATNKTVTWSIVNGTGQATINSTGLVTAVANGTVTARATANDGSGIVGSLVITITGQIIPVTSITVTGVGGSTVISSDNGQLQLTAAVLPADATNKTVTWSIVNGTGQATINPTGLVTAVTSGSVTAVATANDGSGVTGTLIITITNQFVPVTNITVTGAGGSTVISSDNGQLQLTATILPSDATNKTVTWSIVNGSGQATINPTGLVTAVANGTVTARATANDGSGVVGSLVITISGQSITVTGITVTGASGATTITTDNGQLQLTATVLPADATNKTVTWSIVNGTGQATINATGLVTAVTSGSVTAVATANDGSGVTGTLIITISNQFVPVTNITVTGAGGSTVISSDNGQLQLTATVLPTDATNKTVTWSIVNGTGQATINSTGLVTAVANGTVTARATANDGSGVVGSLVITISGQIITVTGITVTGATTITTDNGTLQLTATVTPTDATNKTVTWSIVNGTGQATINSTGLVTAVTNGTVTARATANDGSGVVGSLVITISGQFIPVTGITVTGATTITTDNGTLQLTATVTPNDATNKTVTWSIVNDTGQATINATGLVTAVSNGTVTARATANDGSGVVGSLVITISGQIIPVTSITVTGAGGSSVISSENGQLQLTSIVLPADATNKTVTWSIVNGTGQATINSTGLITAVASGTVTAVATANDGSGVTGILVITITNQLVPVTNITVTGAGGSSVIISDNGQLQLTATVLPTDATNKTVTWSIVNGTGQATINPTGLVTAVANGTITARATANDGSGVVGSLVINISGQVIPVTGITVTGASGATTITTDNGQLQLTATVLPTDATNKTVTWSIVTGTGQATINSTGLVTAVAIGTVTAVATANDGSGVAGTLVITISNQFVPIASIAVTTIDGITSIVIDDGTLQMIATVSPENATNKTVSWSLVKGVGHASISETGLVTARSSGTVTVRATSKDGSNVYGDKEISLINQIVKVTSIKPKVINKSTNVGTVKGELQFSAEIEPADATDQSVTWSVINLTGMATISEKGLLVGVAPGEVIVVATANDGSGVVGELTIRIELVESIKIRYNRYELIVQVPDRLIPAKASLHNLHGSHIQTKVINTTECVFDISGLTPGIYVVSVYNSVVHDAAKIVISY